MQMAGQGRRVLPATGVRVTNNSTKPYKTPHGVSYGQRAHDSARESYTTFLGTPCGTGFTSNSRLAIYYKPSLDKIDNPQYGRLLSDNFMSQTKRHYLTPAQADGSLPGLLNKEGGSGFYQLRNHPKTATVERKTEYQRYFVPQRLIPTVSSIPQNEVGPKGQSGYTEETELQLNTFLRKNDRILEPRRTHNSVMKTDYLRPTFLQGTEPRAGMSELSCRENGYTRGAKAPLACPSSLLPPPKSKINGPTEQAVGKKEPTGSLLNFCNNQAFPDAPFGRSCFTTHYNSTFRPRADYGQTCGGVIIGNKMGNAYTRRDMDRYIFRG